MDLHDYEDVAENYDKYIDSLVGFAGFDNVTCVSFHLELAKLYGHDGILDIGCGTGLIMKPLIEAGFHVTGLDLSDEMLKQSKIKMDQSNVDAVNYKLIKANMTAFKLDEKLSLALIPRSGFLHLLSTEEQIKALSCINRNLEMDGCLSLNTFYPSYDRIALMGDGKEEKPFKRTSFMNKRGNQVDIFNSMVYYHDAQMMKGEWQFLEKDIAGQILSETKRPVQMRWSFESEMLLLFRLTGFQVIKTYGGYDKSEAAYPGQIIWLVKKVTHL